MNFNFCIIDYCLYMAGFWHCQFQKTKGGCNFYKFPFHLMLLLYTVIGNWIHGLTNWIGFNSQMNTDESTGYARRVEFELSWALGKAVMMNLTWVLTQSTWILSESESIIFKKESKYRLNVTITIHFFEPKKSIWIFSTRHYGRSCSRLVLYFYVYFITPRNVRDFGSKSRKVTKLITKTELGKVETS